MEETIYCTNKANPTMPTTLLQANAGTVMYNWGLNEGRYKDYWREFALNPTPDMKMKIWREDIRDEMVSIMEQAYKSFYFRPSYIIRQIGRVKSVHELVNKSKMACRW